MFGLYDRHGILRFVDSDKEVCIAYAELFELGNANYCLVGMSYDDGSGSADGKQALCVAGGTADPSTSAYNLYAHDNINSAEVDIAINSCSINGDLA